MMFNRLVYVTSAQLRQECDKIPVIRKRASMVHELIVAYNLHKHFNLVEPFRLASRDDLRLFHSSAYVDYMLKQTMATKPSSDAADSEALGSDTTDEEDDDLFDATIDDEHHQFGLSYDCPPLPDLASFARCVAGGSITAADECIRGARIVLNWCGGWHHAQRASAEGFCYVNDIALAVQRLRSRFRRILYVDLDIHHGNGVETAFEDTPRVFTLSFHQYEVGFFPGSGASADVGRGRGAGFSCNFPYKGFVGGDLFRRYFTKVTQLVRQTYRPDVCVIQCGADAVCGDPLGGSNLSAADLGSCVRQLLDWQLPTILLGGGGYDLANTARYWTYLTAIACGREESLDDDIPDNRFFLAYGPGYELGVDRKGRPDDLNSESEFANIFRQIEDNLKIYKVEEFE